MDTNLAKIRQNFLDEVKNPVLEDLAVYQQEKANKKAKMTKEDKILQALGFQNKVTMLQAKIDIAGDGAMLLQDLMEIKDEDLFNVFQGMLIRNTDDEHKSIIRQKKFIDEQLVELQGRVDDFKVVEASMSPMFGANYGGAGFDEVVEREVFGRNLSDTFFNDNKVIGE